MRLNKNTKIIGDIVTLIPYEAKHVEKYHEWMRDEDLQKLTASEQLSLNEEYEMQKTWRDDEDKCTFLILSNEIYNRTNNEIQSLIGDTNLFIHYEENEQKSGELHNNVDYNDCAKNQIKIAEAEIMIAEYTERGKHFGWESMLLMLHYGYKFINIQKYIVKIGLHNVKSINMFKKMHFIETEHSVVFNEVTLEKLIDNDWIEWLEKQIKHVHYDEYKKNE